MGCSAETQRVIRTVGFVVSIIISVGFFTAVYIIQNHIKKEALYLESCSFEECPENCKFALEIPTWPYVFESAALNNFNLWINKAEYLNI